jgi:hypothetical protein
MHPKRCYFLESLKMDEELLTTLASVYSRQWVETEGGFQEYKIEPRPTLGCSKTLQRIPWRH